MKKYGDLQVYLTINDIMTFKEYKREYKKS